MSFATINAICDVYNKMTLVEYLHLTHQWMINPEKCREEKKHFTLITLCTSHLMKNLSRDIKSFFPNEFHGKVVIEIFSSFFNIPSFEAVKDVWRKLCFVLKSKFCSDNTEKTLTYLLLQITSVFKVVEKIDEFNDENIKDEIIEDQKIRQQRTADFYEKNKTIYESSPCYKEFLEINLETYVDDQHNGKPNPYHNPELIQCLLKKYVTYLGVFLWSIKLRWT